MTWPLIILLAFIACLLGTVALCFGDAAVDCVRDAVRQWRHGRDDDPFAEACALTGPAPDPTPLPHDFLLWQREMESTP